MGASQPEAFARLVEIKQRQSRQQRVRTAVAHHAFADARRADEIDFLDEHARRMFLAKQDYPRHDIIEERRTERTRPAGAALRIVAGADQIDIGLAVDLAAAQKKGVDTALGGAIEQLDSAVGEKIVLARAEHDDAHRRQPARLVARPQQHGAGRGDRRGGADGDQAHAGEQVRDRRDQDLARRRGRRAHATASSRRAKPSI